MNVNNKTGRVSKLLESEERDVKDILFKNNPSVWDKRRLLKFRIKADGLGS